MRIVKSLLLAWIFIVVLSFGLGNTLVIQEPDLIDAIDVLAQDTTIETWINVKDKKPFDIGEKRITISWNFCLMPADTTTVFHRLRKIYQNEK